ncbi:NADH-quinone oxidoreductase subunit F [Chloroflexota bacterium]
MPEKRIVLKHCGVIDPGDINTYLAQGGFKALTKARDEMTPEQVVAEIKESGLRGRGGAGFPAGLKWELASKASGDSKYVICNADEGEVGTFKDHYILERDPFSLVEAMAIAGYAIGTKQGYIYLRGEYHYLFGLLQNAIAQAQERGLLNGFDVEIQEGAGSYVCGEESALMDSIEGKRGEARFKPPFPPSKGLWEQPTIINNVETLLNVPQIILNGADWFNQIGTEHSKGTKVFSVSGDVQRPGVYELVIGSSLKELVEELAQAKDINLVLVGGASGRALPYDKIDQPLAFETVLGAGAVIVCDETRDVVDIAFQTMEFFAEECCGKCVPCREGLEAIIRILDRFRKGCGASWELKDLEDISRTMQLTSLCGLGQAAPNVVLDTLQYFPNSYRAKIQEVIA